MKFVVVQRNHFFPDSGLDTAYLKIDHWNDYSFVTMFNFALHDSNGEFHEIGGVRIGFAGQTEKTSTYETLDAEFYHLSERYFSLGSKNFYKNISKLNSDARSSVLLALRDVVYNQSLLERYIGEEVFKTSLLRDCSVSTVKGQYSRLMNGGVELTDYHFEFWRPQTALQSELRLIFEVDRSRSPNTNIHAIIGRNGAGKTTLLNDMIYAVCNKDQTHSRFQEVSIWGSDEIEEDYFSSLVSVSFSAFDSFDPPSDQPDRSKGTCYFYLGLKTPEKDGVHKSLADLRLECIEALAKCFYSQEKTLRWLAALDTLNSDDNFASLELHRLSELYFSAGFDAGSTGKEGDEEFEKFKALAEPYLEKLSSGHAIVFLTVTKLVATVEEKALVLMDEPESHLHPPLLAAFIRTLSDLLIDRNGVALIATHSPVVLQEVPKSCVWKLLRSGDELLVERPAIETFGENVGILTREVFRLEVVKSGFHNYLMSSVQNGKSYESIIHELNGCLGLEGRAVLKALVHDRDKKSIIND
ncbi:AAA family ATPase [Simiduia aestuariiviva]|uniref:Putative ATPase n=1 Tax=Simiduia aestuariiviva TaxID=1510459 RepID=A0A839UIP8_9GAMM|nr:AAA family ATPase [Simiduia aestuariiviva]MBB3167732.1 putative ATPase [Simiduia aestuariiviva]